MMTSKQRAYLRSLANSEPTIMQIGKGGIGENLIKTIQLKLKEYSEKEVIEIISLSMSNGWKGIIWRNFKKIENASNRYVNNQQKEYEDLDKFYSNIGE